MPEPTGSGISSLARSLADAKAAQMMERVRARQLERGEQRSGIARGKVHPRHELLLPAVPVPANRRAPCPCGSGRRYSQCHGAVTTAMEGKLSV